MSLNFFYIPILIVVLPGLCFGQNQNPIEDSSRFNSTDYLIRLSGADSLINADSASRSPLSGRGQRIAVWEVGPNAYPNLKNTSISGNWEGGDSFVGSSSHANSLAELMLAKGTDSSLGGLANEAKAVYFNTENFWEEFTVNCSQFHLSLHPYALNPGWMDSYPEKGKVFWGGLEEIDKKEDYSFGRYTKDSRLWDSVLFFNPNHLAIKSAGNSRSEIRNGLHYFFKSRNNSTTDYFLDSSNTKRYKDGGDLGFDALPPVSVSKNPLVIGALKIPQSNEKGGADELQKGSAFGPTDDGRIKPDLVAYGDQTSESAAFAAGAVLLLQEQYQKSFGENALSFVMKCILIHTATDIGRYKGPDFKSGWGLINVSQAARFIQQAKGSKNLVQGELENRDSLRFFYYSQKGENIKLTLVWNDWPGEPIAFANNPILLNNPKPILENDLDITLMELNTGCQMLPYALNPKKPEIPAKNAVNSKDNVESLMWEVPLEGWFEIKIKHKGKLKGGSQKFALALSGMVSGFVFDGENWQPSYPGDEDLEVPILILKGGEMGEKINWTDFHNLSYE